MGENNRKQVRKPTRTTSPTEADGKNVWDEQQGTVCEFGGKSTEADNGETIADEFTLKFAACRNLIC